MRRRDKTIWLIVLAIFAAGVACAIAKPLVILRSAIVEEDPGAPAAPEEYTPPAAPASLAALTAGKTVHTPDDSTELATLLSGGELDSNTLAEGDVIQLAAGTTYTGQFVLPSLGSGAEWTYIVTSGYDSIAAPGSRVESGDLANMPTIQGPSDDFDPAIGFAAEVYKWRIMGVRVQTHPSYPSTARGQIAMDYVDGIYNSETNLMPYADRPQEIVFDRVWVNGRDDKDLDDTKGIRLYGTKLAVINSVITDIHTSTSDDAVGVYESRGGDQILIQNNLIEASSENIMCGGGDSTDADPNTRDVVIRGNYLRKKLKWQAAHPTYWGAGPSGTQSVKNLLEFKKAKRVLVEGNIFEDMIEQDQEATAIVITPRNQSGGDEDATVQDIEIRYNIVRRVDTFIAYLNLDTINTTTEPIKRIWVHDNLFYDANYYYSLTAHLGSGQIFAGGGQPPGEDIRITHNTQVIGPGGTPREFGPFVGWKSGTENNDAWERVVIKDNICEGPDTASRPAIYPREINVSNGMAGVIYNTYEITSNVIFNDQYTGTYPSGNLFPAQEDVGFADYDNYDFALTSGTYREGQANESSDGTDMGADISAVLAATAGVE